MIAARRGGDGNAFLVATSASTPTGYEVAVERVTSSGAVTAGGRFATFAPDVWLGFPSGSLEGRLVYNHEHVYTEGGSDG